ncbi:MAG: hypothetical protein C5B57_12815 [Blastocatellia bacterium]|nr:MAG: hypothetical protein C5B57_12815 [Blastocatellia bacterium]
MAPSLTRRCARGAARISPMPSARGKAKPRLSVPRGHDDSASSIWPPIVLIVSGLLAYSNGLSGPFVLDDLISIVDNESIRQWTHLGSVFFPERELPSAGRPLVNLSFAVNYALGGLNVVGYHLVNLSLHVMCALLVFGLVRRTFQLSSDRALTGTSSSSTVLAQRATCFGLATALLWELHPLNTEAVDYLTQRTELMMAGCYLLTLYAAVRAESSDRSLWQAVAVMSCAAGMLCKESMATAPIMVVLFDRAFLYRSFRTALCKRGKLYVSLAGTWLVLVFVLWSGPRIHSAGFSSGVSVWTYLLNQAIVIAHYLRLAVWPRGLVAIYGPPLNLTLGDVWPYGALIALLALLTVATWTRAPKIGFLATWVFVTLAPTSSIIPIATEVGAERRMYLPLVGLVVLFVAAISTGTSRVPRLRSFVVVLLAAALAAGTVVRNTEYASGVRLAETVVARRPTSVSHHALAVALIDAGRAGEAEDHLRQALAGDPRARYTLGLELFKQAKFEEAIHELQAFIQAEPLLFEAASAREVLGRALAQQQRWPEAVQQYRLAFAMDPSRLANHAEIQGLFAEALYRQQAFPEAVQRYREYLDMRPDDVVALTRLGIALIALKRADEAVVAFRRAVEVDPERGESQRNLAMALLDQGHAAEAADHARRAVALRPNDLEAIDLLKSALAASKGSAIH